MANLLSSRMYRGSGGGGTGDLFINSRTCALALLEELWFDVKKSKKTSFRELGI